MVVVHIIVVGCGRVGAELSIRLTDRGHSVSVMDRVPRAFHRLPEDWPGEMIIGSGFSLEDLDAAGASKAGGLVAVTNGDNTNILTARIAREHYGIVNVVARIYDPRRAIIYQRLGIPTVATVTWTVEHVLQRLAPDMEECAWTDPSGRLVLVERVLPESWAGAGGTLLPIVTRDIFGARSIPLAFQYPRAKLAAVIRAGEPRLDTEGLVGQEGDVLHLVALRGAVAELESLLGAPEPPPVAEDGKDRP